VVDLKGTRYVMTSEVEGKALDDALIKRL